MKRVSTNLIYPSQKMLLADMAELRAIAEHNALQFESKEEIAAFVGGKSHNIIEPLANFARMHHADISFDLSYFSEIDGDANYQGQLEQGAFHEDLSAEHVAYLYWDFLSTCEGLSTLDPLKKTCSEAMFGEIQKYHQGVLEQTDLIKELDNGFEFDEDQLEHHFNDLLAELEETLQDDVEALLLSDDEASKPWQAFIGALPKMLETMMAEMSAQDESIQTALGQSRAYEIFAIADPDAVAQANFLGLQAHIRLASLLLAPQNELAEDDVELLKSIMKLSGYTEFGEAWLAYEQARDLVLGKQEAVKNKILEQAAEKTSTIVSYVLAEQLLQALLPATLNWEFS